MYWNAPKAKIPNFEGKLALARDAVTEAESSLAEADAKAMQKLSEERVKAAADLAETEQQLVKLADRFERLLVRAPSDGVVQELAPKSLGEVVRPGDMVARIVPGARELVAEVRIDPKDSGHILADADAEIRLLTFDSTLRRAVGARTVDEGRLVPRIGDRLEKIVHEHRIGRRGVERKVHVVQPRGLCRRRFGVHIRARFAGLAEIEHRRIAHPLHFGESRGRGCARACNRRLDVREIDDAWDRFLGDRRLRRRQNRVAKQKRREYRRADVR